ncbi:sulfurtransferase TusA family protein [Thermoflexus sp.]|uniref:sulfurtransferase TusA family protein n=1 Tax=Thermoflexus sp. TaxID=1969742 RepID=UPI0025F7441D|nr:sulfurtransferase TusA family protein [Thermoflexus sp.]MCS6963129.1 sulfurtransferase TusA family protein [Thermoflexus sp.]MCS7351103.1 sulfurtransferase TusA family protein [Thermoflexus sp.]MDW8180556.1 sulfurtransferase TusA family protein [Anaerolineae bacterium]MDW8185854.1 sulfurtransferase TusA family protein [Anaerolineae bacterium]
MDREALNPNLELDIRGEVCPYTYVKTRLALEEIEVGQVLRVLVDYEPATHNVPRSVRLQGDEVLKVEPVGERTWAIWIRKRNPSI